MCGIVYVKRKDGKSAVKSVKKRYQKQKFRGMEGFGYVAIKNDRIVSYQRAATEHEIMQKLEKEDAPEILFHHRFPTSTPNMEEQAHPLKISNPGFEFDYYVVHNGVIRNAYLRKIDHEKYGMEYSTDLRQLWQTTSKKAYYVSDVPTKFNDSEALAVDTALVLEGKLQSIDSEGPAAVIALKVKDGKVIERIYYRNNNPLKYLDTSHMVTLTSAGAGKDVKSAYVMRLIDAGQEVHPSKTWTPVAYRTSYHHNPPAVTDAYGQSDIPWGYSPGDDDYDYDRLLGHIPLPPVTPSRIITGEGRIAPATLKALSDDALWEEYDKTLKTLKDVEAGIKVLDDKVQAGIVSEGILTGRKRLQDTLDRTHNYKAQLDGEIVVRTTRANITG